MNKICDECETVAHCTKHGCIPKVSAKDAMKLALEALDGLYLPGELERVNKAITALREALEEQPAQQEPDELRHIGELDCLLDVDEEAWRSLVENRGGCRCHISPPCGACSDPISEEEMNEVGYTYTSPQPAQQEPWSTMPLTELEFKAIRNKLCVQQDGESWDLALKDGINNLLLARFTAHNTSPQPAQQEPVAWRWSESNGQRWFDWTTDWSHHDKAKSMGFPIEYAYTSTPAQRKPLTKDEIENILPDDDTPMSLGEAFVKFARAIEAAHGIRENT